MANGSTRLALAQLQIEKKQQDEEAKLKALSDSKKKGALPKISLKNPTANNHSRP